MGDGRYLFCGQSLILVVGVSIVVEWGVCRMREVVSWSGGVLLMRAASDVFFMLVSHMSLLLLGWFDYGFCGERIWGKWSDLMLWCGLCLMWCLIWFDMGCMMCVCMYHVSINLPCVDQNKSKRTVKKSLPFINIEIVLMLMVINGFVLLLGVRNG